jgi:hypothetical protein
MVRRVFPARGDVQEAVLKLGENPIWTLGKEPIELEGILHIDIDGTVMHGKIPSLQGNYYAFLMEFIIQSKIALNR